MKTAVRSGVGVLAVVGLFVAVWSLTISGGAAATDPLPTAASTPTAAVAAPTTETPLVPTTETTLVADASPGTPVAPTESATPSPGGAATGPVPPGILKGAAMGDPMSRMATKIWEAGGRVIPTGNGHFAVPLPDRIPADVTYPDQVYPPRDWHGKPPSFEGSSTPPWLDPAEERLYRELSSQGKGFTLRKGPDGYRHIVEVVPAPESLESTAGPGNDAPRGWES
jgi:hypothetical protein